MVQARATSCPTPSSSRPKAAASAWRPPAWTARSRLAVADTGSGIAKDALPHIFDRFWQATHAGGAGVGLGLAIVKGIVDAHGARIDVASEPGHGTTFTIALPLAAPRELTAPAAG